MALLSMLALAAMPALAQTTHEVVEDGYESAELQRAPGYTPMTAGELEDLAGPIALYPDDLVSLILPASSYPVQVVQAARYLDNRERDSSLQPPDDWDDAVVALLNYPEVIELMNDDLDWTWALGEAFLNQQAELMDAVAAFRGRAYAAGNLKTDERQVVTVDHEVIEIEPADPEVIYVPYYEPARVVVYQPYPVYYYHRYPRYSYYYPYPADYSFALGYFFGVSTAYRLNWHSHRLYTYNYGYRGHPYYGRAYYGRYYFRHRAALPYRQPRAFSRGGYAGDVWKPRPRHGARPRDGVRTPRAVARSAGLGGSVAQRSAANPAQRYRARSQTTAKRGYVSPFTASKNTSRQASVARTQTDRQPRQQTRVRSSTQPQQGNARNGTSSRATGARPVSPDRSNYTTRSESNRVRSSRPTAQLARQSGNSQTASAKGQTRSVPTAARTYRQAQSQSAAGLPANRARSVSVRPQATRAAPPAAQRSVNVAPRASRPAKAAAPPRARQAAASRSAPARSEKPRATGRKAQRRN